MKLYHTLLLALSAALQNGLCDADIYFEDTSLPDVFENQTSGYRVSLTQFDTVSIPGNAELALSVDRYAFSATQSFSVGKGKLQTAAWYESSIYEFGLGDRTNGQSIGLVGTYSQMLDESWAAYMQARVGSQAEDDAAVSDGLIGSIGLGLQREWGNGFSFGVGLFGQPSAIERDAKLLILPELKWRLNERALFRLAADTGLTFSYDLSGERKTFLELCAQEEGHGFRMRDYAFESIKDVAAFESAPVAVLRLHHRFDNGWHAKLDVGYAGDREFEYYSNGHRVGSFKSDSGAFFGLSFGIRF